MLKIRDVMAKKKVAVHATATLKQICTLLTKHGLSGLPVVNDKNEIIGFVSERDVIAFLAKKDYLKIEAKKLMKKKVSIVDASAGLTEAMQIFSNNSYRLLPVCHQNKLVGLISRKDMVDHILNIHN